MDDDFATLYSRYAPDVFRFAFHLCGRRAEAEDITSETFVRAWTARESIRTATVKGYLFTIARNLHLHALRRSRRQVTIDETLPDRAPGPAARAEQESELAFARAGLMALPEVDRAALVMRACDEMPYEEIARALGLTVSATKVKVHRARLALGGRRTARAGTRRETR